MSERKSVIVTFKRKDQRPDPRIDKLQIVRDALEEGMRAHFRDAATLATVTQSSMQEPVIGYDVNQYEVPIVSARLTESEIQTLRDNGNVANVEYDAPCRAAGYGPYRHLRHDPSPVTSETIPDGVKQVNAPQAWTKSKGKGIRVAVLDTGIDYNHPDLKKNYVDGVSFVDGISSPMDDNKYGHGTHCAGTIAAAGYGTGVIGVAPEASLFAVKVLDKDATGLFSWSIAGVDWCIQKNIHIVSMSLGSDSVPTALKLMCDYAWSKGLLVVSGAGNQDGNPAPPQQSSVDYPAKYRNVVAVSSIDTSNMIALNSGRGPEIDLCAPGVDILSTIPNNGYGKLSGTSAACPHVSGVAALAWALHPTSTNEQIWNLVASTVDDLGLSGRDWLYGYGRVDAYAATQASLPPRFVPKRGI